MSNESLALLPTTDLAKKSDISLLLEQIRPLWQAKNLINRVRSLLPVDPSSACQRLLNAAIHDLREKVAIAGIDIAQQAALTYKLPPVTRSEDLDDYSTAKLLDLAYRMGLLSRAEWRRLSRCYEIRRDLEHEDDEYEAAVEDCIYIFKTCVEVVLSRDPIMPLRITDLKELVDKPNPVSPALALLDDYSRAPDPRQEEIMRFLLSIALDSNQPEIVQQNAFHLLGCFKTLTHTSVTLKLVEFFQQRIGRYGLDRRHARVAIAGGIMPYLKQANRIALFEEVYRQLQKVSPRWTAHREHGAVLRSFQEIGGLELCPEVVQLKILRWLVLIYLGEPGGRTTYGNVRPVFYSNSGAPLVIELIKAARLQVRQLMIDLNDDREILKACKNEYIAARWKELLDLVESKSVCKSSG